MMTASQYQPRKNQTTSSSPPITSQHDSYPSSRQQHHENGRNPSVSCQVQAMRLAFTDMEQDVINHDKLRRQGSTAVAVLLHEDSMDDVVVV
jgi:hypothetical protein